MAFPAGTLVADVVVKTPWAYRRNRYYYEAETPPPGLTELTAIADSIANHFQAAYQNVMSDQSYFQRVECRFYGGGGSDIEANSTGEAVTGSLSPPSGVLVSGDDYPDILPDEVSLMIQVRTGSIGRQKRGRRFITGLSEQMQSKGEIAPGKRAHAKTLADLMSEDIDSTPEGGTIIHARHYNRKDNTLLPITKCYAVSTVASRRDRRKPLKISERI